MKALSIIHPWSWLIFHRGKDVENRTWYTNYRGRILIHVSKKHDKNSISIMNHFNANPKPEELKDLSEWLGCIVGSVELVNCVKNYNSPWAESGLFHWVLKNPKLFNKPIPYRGSLGLWEYEGNIGDDQ